LLGAGDGSFAAHLDYPAGLPPPSFASAAAGPLAVALGDLDGDGHLDIATANSGASTVSVLLGKGDGTFAAKVDYATGKFPTGVVFRDMNRDGNLDVVVVANGSTAVRVFLGLGDGTLVSAVDSPLGDFPNSRSAALGDLDGDGALDLVVGTQGVTVVLGTGDAHFAAPTTYASDGYVNAVYLGDFNGDGLLDILDRTYRIELRLGRGDGTLASAAIYPMPGTLHAIAPGDFDGDGKLDVALAESLEPSGTAGVLLGRGDGSFAQMVSSLDHEAAAIAVGDLDGDGRIDVATAGQNRDQVGELSVLLGRVDGTLSAPTAYSLPGQPILVRLGDLNGDGHLDIVSASSDTSTVSVFLGRAGGTFAKVATDSPGPPTSLALADVDGDGTLDLIVTHTDASTGVGSASVLRGKGDGTFASRSVSPVCDGPQFVAVADVNHDGHLDMVVACDGLVGGYVSGGGVSVLLGRGDGTFATPLAYLGNSGLASVAIGDLNGDGKPDLVVLGNFTISDVSVLLGKGDGTFADPVAYTPPWSARSVALIDIDHDGKLDVVTRVDYSGGWGGAAIMVMLGNGDGTLGLPIDYPVDAQSLAFGDMNGDGRIDLVAGTYARSVNVLLGECR
jgi:hypothetical protein